MKIIIQILLLLQLPLPAQAYINIKTVWRQCR